MSIARELPPDVLNAGPVVRRRSVRRVPFTLTVGIIATVIGLVAGAVSMRSGLAVALKMPRAT